jgi:hypothetical protein
MSQSMCGIEQCSRPAPNATICTQHLWELERDLRRVPSLVEELHITLARASKDTSHTDKVQGKGESPVFFHQAASEALSGLHDAVVGWARDLGALPARSTEGAAANLLRQLPDTYASGYLSKAADEIVDACHRGDKAIDTPANRSVIPVGPCPEGMVDGTACAGNVLAFIPADDRPPRMQCDVTNEHWWSSVQWLRTGRRIFLLAQQRKRLAEADARKMA